MTRFAFPELKLTSRYLAAVIFTSIAASTLISFAAEKIDIYSHRQQVLIQPFLDAFSAKTDIDTNAVYSSKGLAQRLKAEGPAGPADVILTVDIARLSEYADLEFLAPVDSSMIAAHGEAATETCAQAIQLIFANQSNRGNHMNISGGGVAKYAKNKAAAITFLEFLTEEKAQHLYCGINFEYPFNPAVSAYGELASGGRFKPDSLPIERLAALAPKAQMIIDGVGW